VKLAKFSFTQPRSANRRASPVYQKFNWIFGRGSGSTEIRIVRRPVLSLSLLFPLRFATAFLHLTDVLYPRPDRLGPVPYPRLYLARVHLYACYSSCRTVLFRARRNVPLETFAFACSVSKIRTRFRTKCYTRFIKTFNETRCHLALIRSDAFNRLRMLVLNISVKKKILIALLQNLNDIVSQKFFWLKTICI